MKVLWVCNIPLPAIADDMGIRVNHMGGWLTGIAGEITRKKEIELVITFPQSGKEGSTGSASGYKYCGLPQKNIGHAFKDVLGSEVPDLIHIFGTEFHHTLQCVKVANEIGYGEKTIISIQGLVSFCSKHMFANMPLNVIHSWTLRDILKFNNIYRSQKDFEKRGREEIAAIKGVKHVIGRTDWDEACVKLINPEVIYHKCNEILRPSFYEGAWSYKGCEKHSIFVSQCSYPIKGFHQLIKMLPDIRKMYPDVHIYTTGISPLRRNIRKNSYTRYLEKLIHKNHLEDNITFLGMLDEKQMKERYLRTNVFCMCSSIENSPNSLGEAMVLGVPVVASDVGGVKNMMSHNEDGLIYPFDEEYMLPFYIGRLFRNGNDVQAFSENARKHARDIFAKDINAERLFSIYLEVSK